MSRFQAVLVASTAAIASWGCNSTDSPNVIEVDPGTYVFSDNNTENFFVDTNFGGLASEFRVARQFYGRLVSVASCTPAGGIIDIVHDEFVIDPREEDTWAEPFTLSTNPVDGSQMLCIAEDVNDTTVDPISGTSGRSRFLDALIEASGGVRPVTDLGFIGVGNYTMVPRNAAFVIQFDDILDPASINQDSISVLQGDPAIIPFPARVFPDPNYGALADFDGNPGAELYPTRIIVDPAISATESLATSLAPNLTGFPTSLSATLANIQVRIPTIKPSAQINPILQNPTEHTLTTNENGTFDFGSLTRDVVRAFRSGGLESVTGDPFSGFLPDASAPEIVGAQGVVLIGPFQPDASDALTYTIPNVNFNSVPCAQRPLEGDVIVTSTGISTLVLRSNPNSGDLASGTFNDTMGSATNVRVRVLLPVPAQFAADPGAAFEGNGQGAAQYTVRYDDSAAGDGGDRARPECFVTVTPNAAQFPSSPNIGISTDSIFAIRFSEPINSALMEPYESLRLTRNRIEPTELADYISGTLRADINLQEFIFEPLIALEHMNGSSEAFFLSLADGDRAPRDLAGNPIGSVLAPIQFNILDTAPTSLTGSRVSLFNDFDEEAPFADTTSDLPIERIPLREYTGQINYDPDNGRIRPRPVVREQIFVSGAADLPNAMMAGLGTTLPLNPRGARTQFIWRYVDFGLPLYDNQIFSNGLETTRLNVDIEAAYLSPQGSNPVFESYPDFAMSMAHTSFLPDEVINPLTGLLTDTDSGLTASFAGNLLDQLLDPLEEVHPRELGYTINPGDQSLTPDGLTTLIPLPMNQNVPVAEKRFYTWRDTAIMEVGGDFTNIGAPPERVDQVTQNYPRNAFVDPCLGEICGLPGAPNPLYEPGFMRTSVMPILLDFRCFTNGSASTGNRFDHAIAHPTQTAPFFRAFTAGGTTQTGAIVVIDPDSETMANGGFDPTSTPPGAETSGNDNTVYFGALDLVVRVSRAVSIYFPVPDPFTFSAGTGEPTTDYDGTYTNPSFVDPILFPIEADQPQGTSVALAFRGSGEIPAGSNERTDANQMDPYGDFFRELPKLYTGDPDDTIVGVQERNIASCWDGSFGYFFIDDDGNEIINENVSFTNNSQLWRDSMALINGSRFFQVRVSFTSNAATGRAPSLSSIGFGWSN